MGDRVVEALLAKGILTPASLADEARRTVEELLRIEPAARDVPTAEPEVKRLKPEALLSEEFVELSKLLDDDTIALVDGDLARALVTLARRAYPAYLASVEPTRNERVGDVLRLRQLDAHGLAVSAMKCEAELAALFEADRIESPFEEASIWLEYVDPVELLLHGAWHLALLRGECTASSFAKALLEQLSRLRALCKGESVAVPIFLGFGDVRVVDPVEGPAARVRPYLASTHDTLLDTSDRLSRQGGGIVVERALDSTLRMLRKGEHVGGAREKPDVLTEAYVSELRHWADCLAVSIGISKTQDALRPHEIAAPLDVGRRAQLRWILNANPLSVGTSLHFSQGWQQDSLPAIEFDSTTLRRAETLAGIQEPSIRTAIGRLSYALEWGRRWLDGFLDAVIAWEALAGDCTGAVSTKLCAVIAHLVAVPGQRKQVREKLRTLYGHRSRLVRGGHASANPEDRAAAILVGMVALTDLVEARPTLLKVQKRFEVLCLDSGD
jgi:hypothetical protein